MSKRRLTINEINNILESIIAPESFPEETRTILTNRYRSLYFKDLSYILIYPQKIKKLKEEIIRQHNTSIVSAGETVGVLCGQAKGQMLTQSVLNTFHTTGTSIASVNVGLPRFKELLSATSDPKIVTTTIFFKDTVNSLSELRDKTVGKFTEIKFKDCVIRKKAMKSPILPDWVDDYLIIYKKQVIKSQWYLIVKLDRNILYENRIRLSDISSIIEDRVSSVSCMFSPQHICELYIGIDIELAYENLTDIIVNDFIIDEIFTAISDIKLCGISGIGKLHPHKLESKSNSQYIAISEGTNLEEILGNPIVDSVRTICDHMREILYVLGIEAVRTFLKKEYTKVISSDGSYISEKHINLLVDSMCYDGDIYSVSRHGIKRKQVGPIAKIAFEECLENLIIASIYGEKDNTNGVSSSVMFAKNGRFGTGMIDTLYDFNKH